MQHGCPVVTDCEQLSTLLFAVHLMSVVKVPSRYSEISLIPQEKPSEQLLRLIEELTVRQFEAPAVPHVTSTQARVLRSLRHSKKIIIIKFKMSSGQDIVVTSLNISDKEQQLKQRFLTNSRPEVIGKVPVLSAPDPGFTSFLEEMQITLKQQANGNASNELLKQQSSIMQQQVELMREERKAFDKVLQHMAKPQSEDPKRVLAELLAPLNKQIIEVKNFYEETKNTAKEIVSQVNDLKKTISDHKPSKGLQKSVDEGMATFARKKAIFDSKVKQAESMVSEVAADAEDHLNLGGCKQGIDYLRQQIEIVSNDTEKMEIELLNRYQRMMQQVQKVKTLPSSEVFVKDLKSTEERVRGLFGESIDYDEILSEVEKLNNYKNAILQEYRKGTLVYPKPVKSTAPVVVEKKVQKKPVQMHPMPSGNVKKTFKTKPNALQNIPTQPKQFASKPKVEKPLSMIAKPLSIEEKAQKSSVNTTPREKPPTPTLLVKKDQIVTPRSEEIQTPPIEKIEMPLGPMPRAASPSPFQTKPGVTKGEQTSKTLTFPDIYPGLKNIETQEPPRPSIEQRTVDAVTEFVLTQLINPQKSSKSREITEIHSSKWLGVEELSELTRLGIYADPITIDRLGKEILSQGIKELKQKSPAKAPPKSVSLVRELKKPEIELEETEEKYDSDFEASSSEKIEEKSERPEGLFDKISPKTPPHMYEKRFEPTEHTSATRVISHTEENFQSLFDPRLLGMMSAASIQHYISALIEAGHLPKPQDTPSFFTRSPSPGTQHLATPQYRPISDTTILEPKVPEEVKEFMSSQIGSQILNTIKTNPNMSPQQVMENWANKQGFTSKYPPQQEVPHAKTDSGIFGKPSHGAKIFNLAVEEKKLHEESSIIRKTITIPLLEIHKKQDSSDSYRLITDSEVSALSNSGSIGSEIFNIENPEFMGGFMEFVRKARELEEGQVPGNSDLSEGEVRMDYEGLSSGEIPREVMVPLNFAVEKNQNRVKIPTRGLLSDDVNELSEGEFDPNAIFKV